MWYRYGEWEPDPTRIFADIREMTPLDLDVAQRARDLAAAHCLRTAGDSCAWYHGFWPFLSALGLVTVPSHHGPFYRVAIQRLPKRVREYRVLVCGTADHAMPDAISDSCTLSGHSARLTVLDRCETPLRLSRWQAERRGEAIETVCCDILDFRAQSGFDLICTHSFLGYFDRKGRERLVERWRGLLRPGGRVLAIHRIRPGAAEWVRFTDEQALAFRESVTAAAARAGPTRFALEEIAEMAREYTMRFRIRPVASKAELRELFEGRGFTLRCSELGRVKTGSALRPSAPTAIGDGFYVSLDACVSDPRAPATSD